MWNAAPEQVLLYVDVENAKDPNNEPNFLTFRIFPKQDFGNTTLEFLFELPNGAWIDHPVYKLKVANKELPADDHIQQSETDPFMFSVTVPDLPALEYVHFSIGWYGATFEDYKTHMQFKGDKLAMPYFGSWERKAMKGWNLVADE